MLDKFLICGLGFSVGVFWTMFVMTDDKKMHLLSLVMSVIALGILFLC